MRVLALLSLGIIIKLLGCSSDNAPPAGELHPPAVGSFIRARASNYARQAMSQVGLKELVFDYSIPQNTQCTVWLKAYVRGKLDRQLCQIQKYSPGGGQGLAGQLVFNRYDPSVVTEATSTRAKWYFGMKGWSSSWVDDPFKKTGGEMPLTYDHKNLELGRTYTVGCIVGAKKDRNGGMSLNGEGGEAAIAAKNAVAVFIKMRLDPSDTRAKHPSSEIISGQVPEFDETP